MLLQILAGVIGVALWGLYLLGRRTIKQFSLQA